MKVKMIILFLLFVLTACQHPLSKENLEEEEALPLCYVVGSYHTGYEGQDALVEGIMMELEGIMDVELVSMNTKLNPSDDYAQDKGIEIYRMIKEIKPDIVIAMDDNASKYLVEPYLKDDSIPIVFVGVNWSADKYGYPYSNASGMIEVHPIRQAIEELDMETGPIESASCIRPATLSDLEHFKEFKLAMEERGVEVIDYPVEDYQAFKEAYVSSQETDLVYFTNYSGIENWNDQEAWVFMKEELKTMTFSTNPWMQNFVCVEISMDSIEQGRYAGMLAKDVVLGKLEISDVPIVSNRRYHVTINQTYSDIINADYSIDFITNAIKVYP